MAVAPLTSFNLISSFMLIFHYLVHMSIPCRGANCNFHFLLYILSYFLWVSPLLWTCIWIDLLPFIFFLLNDYAFGIISKILLHTNQFPQHFAWFCQSYSFNCWALDVIYVEFYIHWKGSYLHKWFASNFY